jgi:Uma2 family endonuclease
MFMQSLLENSGIRDAVLRLDVDQYHRLCSSGIVPERTELLEGVVVEKTGKSPLHTWTVAFLEDWFRTNLLDGLLLRVEQPLTLGSSEPEPDLAIVTGHRDDFRLSHPDRAEVVVEVAVTTAELDRAKSRIYAEAGIPLYLLVLPEQKQIVLFMDIREGLYSTTRFFDAADHLELAHITPERLEIAQLFPE